MIEIEQIDEKTFEVTVEADTTTVHRVTVEPEVHERLTDGSVLPAELVRESFEFLLEREPNTSILSSFELPVIGRYFPEYEREIRRRVGS